MPFPEKISDSQYSNATYTKRIRSDRIEYGEAVFFDGVAAEFRHSSTVAPLEEIVIIQRCSTIRLQMRTGHMTKHQFLHGTDRSPAYLEVQ